MGQQQLLILVLTIVVVSIAVYIGIDLFDRMMQQRHVDLLVNHTVMVASEAAAWRSKESPWIGGGGSYAQLDPDGMKSLRMAAERVPGTLEIQNITANELDVVAVSNDFPLIGVRTHVEGTKIVETVIVRDGSITLSGGTGDTGN